MTCVGVAGNSLVLIVRATPRKNRESEEGSEELTRILAHNMGKF